jgi:hypothetical protein
MSELLSACAPITPRNACGILLPGCVSAATGACGQLVIEHKQQSACSQEAPATLNASSEAAAAGKGSSSSSSRAVRDIEELGQGVAAVSLRSSQVAAAPS